MIRLVGGSGLPVATKAIDEAAERISHYLLMQSVINGTFGAAVALGLFLIGLPYAVLWGFLAAVLRFIPYVGAWVAALMPLTLALAVFQGWQQPLFVLALFAALEPLIFLVVEPVLYGRGTGVSDVALLVAAFFWTWLWGPVGLLLATPLTVCLVVLGKYVPDLGFLGVLLGEAPELEPHVAYYQRLLAEDEDEAARIVEEYVRTSPPDQVYDAVLLPALKSVKRDRGRGVLTEEDARFIVNRTREIVEELELPPAPAAGEPVRASPPRPRRAGRAGTADVPPAPRGRWGGGRGGLDDPARVGSRRPRSGERAGGDLHRDGPAGGPAHARYLVKRVRAARPDAGSWWAAGGRTGPVRRWDRPAGGGSGRGGDVVGRGPRRRAPAPAGTSPAELAGAARAGAAWSHRGGPEDPPDAPPRRRRQPAARSGTPRPRGQGVSVVQKPVPWEVEAIGRPFHAA